MNARFFCVSGFSVSNIRASLSKRGGRREIALQKLTRKCGRICHHKFFVILELILIRNKPGIQELSLKEVDADLEQTLLDSQREQDTSTSKKKLGFPNQKVEVSRCWGVLGSKPSEAWIHSSQKDYMQYFCFWN